MADGRLRGAVDLRQGAAERRVEEDRVVAEAVRARRLRRNLPLDHAAALERDPAVLGRMPARRRTAPGWSRARARAAARRSSGTSRRSRCRASAPSGRRGRCRARRSRGRSRRRRSAGRSPPRSTAPSAARSPRRWRRFPRARRSAGSSASVTSSTGAPARMPLISRILPGLVVAMSRRHARLISAAPMIGALHLDQRADAVVGELHQASSAWRSNGGPSAVPCTSMNRPSPVLTTFMSTSARESSS